MYKVTTCLIYIKTLLHWLCVPFKSSSLLIMTCCSIMFFSNFLNLTQLSPSPLHYFLHHDSCFLFWFHKLPFSHSLTSDFTKRSCYSPTFTWKNCMFKVSVLLVLLEHGFCSWCGYWVFTYIWNNNLLEHYYIGIKFSY